MNYHREKGYCKVAREVEGGFEGLEKRRVRGLDEAKGWNELGP